MPNLILSLTTYNRFEYLERSINSLYKINYHDGVHLVISDDCSTDQRVINLLKSLKTSGDIQSIDVKFRDKNVGVTTNCTNNIKDIFSKYGVQYCVLINSDGIYNPEWLNQILLTKRLVEDEHYNIGAITSFNYEYTNKYPYGHKIIGYTPKHHVRIKESVGGFGVLINKFIFEQMTTYENGWDCRYVDTCYAHNFPMFATDRSYSQHIGEEGLHTLPDGQFDNARDFIGE